MSKHGTDQSAKEVISATSLKMLATDLVGSIPQNLPEQTAIWWTRRGEDTHLRGAHLLVPEVQKILWNPPTVRNEVVHWSRFYQMMFGISVSFDNVPHYKDRPAGDWVFVPAIDPGALEHTLQSCCNRLFPSFQMRRTSATLGGNKFCQGNKYAIEIEQREGGGWAISKEEGLDVTLAELLARELYFYFRGFRRPKNEPMYAIGSWFDDEKVPVIKWVRDGMALSSCPRREANYWCIKTLCVIES